MECNKTTITLCDDFAMGDIFYCMNKGYYGKACKCIVTDMYTTINRDISDSIKIDTNYGATIQDGRHIYVSRKTDKLYTVKEEFYKDYKNSILDYGKK